jgi:hypothetical protein
MRRRKAFAMTGDRFFMLAQHSVPELFITDSIHIIQPKNITQKDESERFLCDP